MGLHICKLCELFSACYPKFHCSTNALPVYQGSADVTIFYHIMCTFDGGLA